MASKSRAELEDDLREQVMRMRQAAVNYDNRDPAFAKDLSVHLFTLFFDGQRQSKSRSLLSQLDLLNDLNLISTAAPISPQVRDLWISLVSLSFPLDGPPKFIPGVRDAPTNKTLAFDAWWNEAVYEPTSDVVLSRKDLVLTMRNQDGGGHVDPEIAKSEYVRLKSDGPKRLTYVIIDDERWPAAGFVDTEIGCFMMPEVANGKTTVRT